MSTEPEWIGKGKVRARLLDDGTLEAKCNGITTQAKYYKPLFKDFFRKDFNRVRPGYGDYEVHIVMEFTGDPPIMDLDNLAKALREPKRPLVAIVGGSKVSTKLTVLETLSTKVDQLIVGGGIANTFLAAAGHNVGKSLCEPDLLDDARRLMEDRVMPDGEWHEKAVMNIQSVTVDEARLQCAIGLFSGNTDRIGAKGLVSVQQDRVFCYPHANTFQVRRFHDRFFAVHNVAHSADTKSEDTHIRILFCTRRHIFQETVVGKDMVDPAFQTFEKERKSKQIEAAVVFGDVIRGNGHHLKRTELKFFGRLSVGTQRYYWFEPKPYSPVGR